MQRWSIKEVPPVTGATHQKALVNSPHLSFPGVPGPGVGGGRSRLPIRLRLRARFLHSQVQRSAPATHRVLGEGKATTCFPSTPGSGRAPRESSVPDRRPSVQDTRCGSPVKGSSTRWLGIWAHPRTERQGQSRVHSPKLVEASTCSGSLPWSASISQTPGQRGNEPGRAEHRKRLGPSCWLPL